VNILKLLFHHNKILYKPILGQDNLQWLAVGRRPDGGPQEWLMWAREREGTPTKAEYKLLYGITTTITKRPR
jgi:hypothetical protein